MSITLGSCSVWYRDSQILRDIDAVFDERRITALLGPSGCGKTTLLKTITRIAELQSGFRLSGEVMLGGGDVYRTLSAPEARRRMAMVFQKPVALPLSIRENVLFGPRYYGLGHRSAGQITEQCLQEAGLWEEVKDKLDQPANRLSGGQLQRLTIARALALEPEAILLDEPCSSLDVHSTRSIEETLVRLARRMTVIIVTHNLAQARRIAQTAHLLFDGRLVESGPAAEVLNNPRHELSQEFLAGQL